MKVKPIDVWETKGVHYASTLEVVDNDPIVVPGFDKEFELLSVDDFRRDAAKDILCALIARGEKGISHEDLARKAVNIADALIKELKREEQ